MLQHCISSRHVSPPPCVKLGLRGQVLRRQKSDGESSPWVKTTKRGRTQKDIVAQMSPAERREYFEKKAEEEKKNIKHTQRMKALKKVHDDASAAPKDPKELRQGPHTDHWGKFTNREFKKFKKKEFDRTAVRSLSERQFWLT